MVVGNGERDPPVTHPLCVGVGGEEHTLGYAGRAPVPAPFEQVSVRRVLDDLLRNPNGEFHKFRLRSLVGLIPLYAIEVLESEELTAHPGFLRDVEWFIQNRPDLVGDACYTVGDGQKRYVLSIADPNQFKRLLQRIWDPAEFLSNREKRRSS